MSKETIPETTSVQLDIATRLAFERTYLAYENTQMAWVRTALSFISFGFAIAKFFEYLHEKQPAQAPLMSPSTVGILMIAIGLAALVLATLRHRWALEALRRQCPGLPISLAGATGVVLGLLGILALFGAALR